MPFAIRVYETGGPEKMIWEKVDDLKEPGPREVIVRNQAIGVNFVDVYYRNGFYSTALPMIPGAEGAGTVELIGSEVTEFSPGDRVAYAEGLGSYSEFIVRPAQRLVRLPQSIDNHTAAAILLKGMTAEYLIQRTYRVKKGDFILVHAAAGGVGQILCQWASHLGATVIGTVGSDEKVKIAFKSKCDHVILLKKESISTRVRDLTHGQGVSVVYDGIGKDTFTDSLDSLAPRGLMVSYGNASGAVPPFQIGGLLERGSLYLTRPSLVTYIAKREELENSARELFKVVEQGVVKVSINQTYPLREAAQAHRDLEARRTTGSTLLLPGKE